MEGDQKRQLCVKTRGWGLNHSSVMQTVLSNRFMFCPWLRVEHSQRSLGRISSEESLLIDSSDRLQRVFFSFPLSEECHCVSGIPQMRGGCSLWTMPSLSRRLRGLTLFVWPLKGEFSTRCLPRREQLFSPSCFIDTGGSGSLQSVWQCLYRENIDASARGC